MSELNVRPLSDEHAFGCRIDGLRLDALADPDVRAQVRQLFEDKGLIVFEEVDPTGEMQMALSAVVGPLQDHAFRGVPLVAGKTLPGVVDFDARPSDPDVMEIDGKLLASWVAWHFDACYSDRLNRAGLLRPLVIPPEGGLTGFADGIQLYHAISPELRDRFGKLEILYHTSLMFDRMRFGRPGSIRIHRLKAGKAEMFASNRNAPRSIHPAVWQRATGEFVLHVSPWQADGIAGMEGPEGDALLEALCTEIYARMQPYFHQWHPRDMVLWDNWRFLHSATGHDPGMPRHMHRSTIEGDYGLGRYETRGPSPSPT